MNTHKNARLTAWARQEIVTRVKAGETQGAIAAALGVSRETVNKWYRRLSLAAEPAQAAPDCHHQYEIAQSHQAELRTWELSCEALRRPRADATLVSSLGGGDWCTAGIPSCCYSICWSRGSGSEPLPSS
ncbi:MAG: helix-turn-helix domain containing protein [Gemmatimonadaceae bacterium]|nr:helix-turn-helix domain containing protein [Gemmatimonadaceae bacterium]